MAVERKNKNRRKLNEVQEKPTKDEYAVAKFLRFNAPRRGGKLVGMEVTCFFGNKAVDALMNSKWSAAKTKKDPLFTNRGSCVSFCNRLLQKGLFHRAEKVQRSKDRDKSKLKKKKLKEGEKEEEGTEEGLRERKKKDKKGKKEGETEKPDDEDKEETEKKEEKKPEKEEEKKKKEKKLKLNMHEDQWFVDGDEVYVWIYDPVPLKTFLIGLLMLFGAIALCLFPLWPEFVRIGVYYISLAAAGFVGFILVLVVVRLILFSFVWVFTLGNHHFWFLPNLTEDVGFFDSFKPLYKHDHRDKNTTPEKSKDKTVKESKKEKDEETKGVAMKEEVEKDENSASDKSENGEFEIVDKDDLANGDGDKEIEEDTAGMEEENEEEEDENDFDDEESDNTEEKKDK